MPDQDHCNDCGDRWIIKCSKCQARGYLLTDEGEAISGGDYIVICAWCNGTGAEPCPTCGRPFLPDG